MICLDKSTRKLQAVLAGAVTTNQLQCVVSFYDVPKQTKDDNAEYQSALQLTSTNSGTDVDICAAPPANGTVRNVRYISVYNADTVGATVTIKIDDGGTDSILVKQALLTTETLVYTSQGGWQII